MLRSFPPYANILTRFYVPLLPNAVLGFLLSLSDLDHEYFTINEPIPRNGELKHDLLFSTELQLARWKYLETDPSILGGRRRRHLSRSSD